MTNPLGQPAVTVELHGDRGNVMRYTVADGTAISGGTLMKASNPKTAAEATADNDIVAGIAAAAKEANDGATTLGLYQKGIFDIMVDDIAAVAVGDDLTISGANTLKKYTTLDNEKGYVLGKALESTSGGTPEVILVKVNLL